MNSRAAKQPDTKDGGARRASHSVIIIVALFVVAALAAVLARGTATPQSAGAPRATDTVSHPTVARPTATVTPTPQLIQLVVAHTNDTWGYLYPCG